MGNLARSLIQKQYPIAQTSSRVSFGAGLQSKQSKESYLCYYSEISWLRAAVSIIAESVAQSDWRLYRKKKGGDREEVTEEHELKNLLNRPNPFQSGHDLLELHQIFDELIGEVYWTKQKEMGSRELWIVPPQYMTVIPDAHKFIGGYHFERGDSKHDFKPEEIIPFIQPNPMDMLIGTGRAQAAGIDIENQSFMSQYNRNFFYWGADPGTIITYPVEANITPDELDRLNEQWNAGHRSYGRAHKAAILTQGATIQREGIGQRDMDFVNLSKYNRDAILGVFGVSYSMVGGTESINRANAEAQLLSFARWVITPRLTRIREKLNMFLCPDYGSDLEVDYDSPVPEDTAQQALEVDNHVKSGVISIEEARQLLDQGDVEPTHHFLIPFNFNVITGQELMSTEITQHPPVEPVQPPAKPIPPEEPVLPEEPTKSISDPKVFSDVWKENFWKANIKQTEAFEPKAIKALRNMYGEQRAEALANVQGAIDRNHKLIDKELAKKAYDKAVTPILTSVILNAVSNAMDLIKPENPHKQDIPPILNRLALEWLKTHIGWAAEQTTEETARLLADALAQGFSAGESTDQIAQRVSSVFDNCDDVRAQRIARTEILSASNEGATQGYKEMGIGKVEFYTALDERTCDICMGMHGDIENIDDAPPIPASTHPQCRCIWLPVVE